MYWYKPSKLYRIIFVGASLCLLIFSCKPEIKETGGALKYFDLKGYFYADSAKLTKLNPMVEKTVSHNGTSETKKMHVANWGAELSLFTGADINKPAWKDSYTISSTNTTTIYQATDPDLEIRRIIITKSNDKVKWIMVFGHAKNMLYETREKLVWFPDSMYSIYKTQQVRLLGKNTYSIKGIIH